MGEVVDVQELVKSDRTRRYADTWKLTGKLYLLAYEWTAASGLWKSEYHPIWVKILSKMVRILSEHDVAEHWIDIAGYAQLVIDDLEGKNADEA